MTKYIYIYTVNIEINNNLNLEIFGEMAVCSLASVLNVVQNK